MEFLLALPLTLIGISVGICIGSLIGDHRIDELSPSQYMAMHQVRDKTFSRVMPPLKLSTIALVALSSMVLLHGDLPQVLGLVVTILLVVDVVMTISGLVPINREVQAWTVDTIPANWAEFRDRWAANHNVRTGVVIAAYVLFLAAVLLMNGP